MKDYTNNAPAFSEIIQITETSDPAHADIINKAPIQIFQNTLHNRKTIEKLKSSAGNAEVYNTETEYQKGNYCTYNDAMYKCIQPTQGEWDPTCWEEINLLSEISDLQIPEFDDSGTAAGITSFPTFLQKVKSKMNIFEFYRNFKAGMQYVLHAGQIVNNCASDAADLPLAAAQGKALWDQITRLNSEKLTFNMKRISGAHRCDAPNTYEYTGTSIVVPPCKFYIAIGHLGWSMGKPTGIVLAGSANSISNGELTDVLESDLLNTRYVYHIGVDGNIALYLWERRASIPDETTLNSNSIVVLYFT